MVSPLFFLRTESTEVDVDLQEKNEQGEFPIEEKRFGVIAIISGKINQKSFHNFRVMGTNLLEMQTGSVQMSPHRDLRLKFVRICGDEAAIRTDTTSIQMEEEMRLERA